MKTLEVLKAIDGIHIFMYIIWRLGMNTKTKKKDIQYGDIEVDLPSTWNSSETKVRITTFLDEDLLIKIKKEAKIQGKKYQSLLNEKLREIFMGEKSLETRLKKLEEEVFKKKMAQSEKVKINGIGCR